MENPFKAKKEEEINNDIVEKVEDSTITDESTTKTEDKTVEEANDSEKTEENPLQAKYDELNNHYLRLAADFDNYRKRQAQERENLLKYGAENTVKKLIEVLDNFDRGAKAIEKIEDCEKVKECYQLAFKNFVDVLNKIGLEEIKAEGEQFDPNLHEAVMQTPTSDKPEHTIIAELQKGYKLGEKVLRPTLVNVATSEG